MFVRQGSVLVSLVLVVMTGCLSLSTMQTPATVPKGKLRMGVGLEGVGTPGSMSDTKAFPQFEVNARFGVSDSIDVGAKVFLAGVEAGGKYQFLKGTFEAALAPSVSYLSVDLSDLDLGKFSLTYLHVPLLLGVKLTDSLELAFGPKALFVIGRSTDNSMDQSVITKSTFIGGGFASIQLRLGRSVWIAPEINVYKAFPTVANDVIWQGGLVLLFGGAAPAPSAPPP